MQNIEINHLNFPDEITGVGFKKECFSKFFELKNDNLLLFRLNFSNTPQNISDFPVKGKSNVLSWRLGDVMTCDVM